jgi:hypothetical protein
MTIEEFISRYFSLQQTALVDNMLYEDKHMNMLNSLYNLHMHTIELSTGTFTGTHNQLMAKKATIYEQLQDKKSAALKRDIELLETTQGNVRTVYEWYALPYWVARHMIDSDEVVLSWRDCYWWGRCTTGRSLIHENAVLELFTQYDASQ